MLLASFICWLFWRAKRREASVLEASVARAARLDFFPSHWPVHDYSRVPVNETHDTKPRKENKS